MAKKMGLAVGGGILLWMSKKEDPAKKVRPLQDKQPTASAPETKANL